MDTPHKQLDLPHDLGDGLILRLATEADIPAVADLNARIHEEDEPRPNFITRWTEDLMCGRHPTTRAADFVIVEDSKADGKLVCTTCLIPQTWRFDDIKISVGRPELVGTDKAYRRRGLVRAVFEQIHALSAAYGHQVQVITGIPWFYRMFEYEFALPLGGGRNMNQFEVPKLKDDEQEPFALRKVTPDDAATITRLHNRQFAKNLVAPIYTETDWRFRLSGPDTRQLQFAESYFVLNEAKAAVGYFTVARELWGDGLGVMNLMAAEGESLSAMLPTILRKIQACGQIALEKEKEKAAQKAEGDTKPEEKHFNRIMFRLGVEHPVYTLLDHHLSPRRPPYGLYVRVPDVPGFVRHIAPVLERRLATSAMAGHTGELKLNFYRDGLKLVFEKGRLTAAEPWRMAETNDRFDGAEFPPLTFLHLLFGNKTFAELDAFYPDCGAHSQARILLEILFPKQYSWVEPIS